MLSVHQGASSVAHKMQWWWCKWHCCILMFCWTSPQEEQLLRYSDDVDEVKTETKPFTQNGNSAHFLDGQIWLLHSRLAQEMYRAPAVTWPTLFTPSCWQARTAGSEYEMNGTSVSFKAMEFTVHFNSKVGLMKNNHVVCIYQNRNYCSKTRTGLALLVRALLIVKRKRILREGARNWPKDWEVTYVVWDT